MAALPPGVAGVFGLMTAVGWVSGYRPFRARWDSRTPASPADADLSRRLAEAAAGQGFALVSRDRDGVQFVATRDIAMETKLAVHSGSKFPMRLSLLRTRGTDVRPGQAHPRDEA